MKIRVDVWAIGGDSNETIVGTANDAVTALSLIKLVEYSGGSGVSLHGSIGEEKLSGDCTFSEARQTIESELAKAYC